MLRHFLKSESNGFQQKKSLRLLCLGFFSVLTVFGGLVWGWTGFAAPGKQKELSSEKTASPLFSSDNDSLVNIRLSSEKKDLQNELCPSPSAVPDLSSSIKVSNQKPEAVIKQYSESPTHSSIYPGRVLAFKKSILTFRVPGPLLKINVVPGQSVKKGEPLMQIDPRDYQIQVDLAQSRLDAARANLNAMRQGVRPEDVALLRAKVEEAEATFTLAEKEFERAKTLVNSKTISISEYDTASRTYTLASLACNSTKKELEKGLAGARKEDIQAAEAEIRGLEASLAAAKNSLDDTTLRAPYDGIITTKMIEEYEMVTTTPTYRTVLGIHDISRLKIEIYVPEREMISGHIQTGKTVSVRFTAKRENVYPAKLSEIDTEPSEVGMTYKLTFLLDRPHDLPILPGMISEVSLPISMDKK